jgi:anti-sigma regulatory factor (Ser/Thr protein kinase)
MRAGFQSARHAPARLDEPARETGNRGRGIHLVKSLMDDASYAREGAVNILVLIKQVGSTV